MIWTWYKAHLSSLPGLLRPFQNWLDKLKNAWSTRIKARLAFYHFSELCGPHFPTVLCFLSHQRNKQFNQRQNYKKTGDFMPNYAHRRNVRTHTQAHMHAHTLGHILTYLNQGPHWGCASRSSPCISHVPAWLYSARTPRQPGGNTQTHTMTH